MTYYPDYQPKNVDHFEQMIGAFTHAVDVEQLRALSVLYILDVHYDREDIAVALGRVEREKGWRV